jgi:extradiol dioxygenase family protein
MKKLMILVAMTLFTLTAANAQFYGNSEGRSRGRSYEPLTSKSSRGHEMTISHKQRHIREKIGRGISRGTIHSKEAGILLEMAERIEAKEKRFMRNGHLNAREKRELEADLAHLERMVAKSGRNSHMAHRHTRKKRL